MMLQYGDLSRLTTKLWIACSRVESQLHFSPRAAGWRDEWSHKPYTYFCTVFYDKQPLYIEMANNVRQYEDNLNAWEQKITAQFQEFLTLFQSANKLQIIHAPQTKTMMKQSKQRKIHSNISISESQVLLDPQKLCSH